MDAAGVRRHRSAKNKRQRAIEPEFDDMKFGFNFLDGNDAFYTFYLGTTVNKYLTSHKHNRYLAQAGQKTFPTHYSLQHIQSCLSELLACPWMPSTLTTLRTLRSNLQSKVRNTTAPSYPTLLAYPSQCLDLEKRLLTPILVVQHMETYWSILEKIPGSKLRLTKFDDEIYEQFQKDFPNFDAKATIIEDEMKSAQGKEQWRNFVNKYENKVDDYNFGTMLRANPSWEYGQKEVIFGTLSITSKK